MGDGEVAMAALRLAGVDQPLQDAAVDVVGDRLTVEHAEDDGVRIGIRRQRGG